MKLLKQITSVLVTVFLGLALLIAPISSASAHDVPGSTLDTRNKGWITDMFNYINEHRTNNGLTPLRFNATASEVAEDWADVTLRNGNPAHGGTAKSDPRVANRTIKTGENVAGEIIGNVDAKTIFLSWKNSPAHNSAMLQPDFEVIGLGFNHTSTGTMYAVTQFYTFKPGQEPAGAYNTAAGYFATTGTLTVDPGTPFYIEHEGARFYSLYDNYTTAFELDGRKVNAEDGALSKNSHTLKLVPKTGYKFPSGAKTTWSYPDIREVALATDPYFDPFILEYRIPGTGCDLCKDTYYVNGKATAPGRYSVAPGTKLTITVKAPANADYKLAEPTSWTHTFPGGGTTTPPATNRPLTAAQPLIIGTPQVGKKLSTDPGTWTEGATLRYQWQANGKNIPQATSQKFTPEASHRGQKISVRVSGSKAGYTSKSKTSDATAATKTGVLSASSPTISGTARVGKTLKAKAGSWTGGTKLSYRWYANGKAIKGANKASYNPAASTKGKRISVRVSGSKAGYTSISKTKQTSKVKAGILKTAKPKIAGTPRVGKTLKAKAGSWTWGTKLSYRWYANGKTINGAKKSTLKVGSKHKGKKISVKVTGTKKGYTTKTLTSAKTAKIKRR